MNSIRPLLAAAALLGLCLSASGSTPADKLVDRLKHIEASTTQQGVQITITVSGAVQDKAEFRYRQKVVANAPAGTYTIDSDYRIPFASLSNTSSRIEDTGLGTVKFIIEAAPGTKPFFVTVREYSTGAYTHNTTQGTPAEGTESFFGFVFTSRREAKDFQKLWSEFRVGVK